MNLYTLNFIALLMYISYNVVNKEIRSDKMKFINMEHHNRFNELKKHIPANLKGDKKLIALAYIMSSNQDIGIKMSPYVDWKKSIDYNKMMTENTFLKDEEVLVKLANSLYTDTDDLQFNDVFKKLNENQQEVAINAAKYRYNNYDIYQVDHEIIYIK